MEPGDVLSHTDSFGIKRRWIVRGVYLGGEGQESVVEITGLFGQPPIVGGKPVTMFVPEVLLRGLYNRAEKARGRQGRGHMLERPEGGS